MVKKHSKMKETQGADETDAMVCEDCGNAECQCGPCESCGQAECGCEGGACGTCGPSACGCGPSGGGCGAGGCGCGPTYGGHGSWGHKKMLAGFALIVLAVLWYLKNVGTIPDALFWPIVFGLAGLALLIKGFWLKRYEDQSCGHC